MVCTSFIFAFASHQTGNSFYSPNISRAIKINDYHLWAADLSIYFVFMLIWWNFLLLRAFRIYWKFYTYEFILEWWQRLSWQPVHNRISSYLPNKLQIIGKYTITYPHIQNAEKLATSNDFLRVDVIIANLIRRNFDQIFFETFRSNWCHLLLNILQH